MSSRTKVHLFNNRSGCPAGRGAAGFTLLEVMVAVAVIAIAFVTLLGAQSQSVSIATGSKFDAMASLLAQGKLADLGVQNYSEVTSSSGNFGEDFPGFSWKTEVSELSDSETGIKGAGGMLKAVDLTVLLDQDAALAYTLRTVVCKKITAVK
jgi:general secretion pathway protein I